MAGSAQDSSFHQSFLVARNLSNGSVDSSFNNTAGFNIAQFTGSLNAEAMGVVPILSGTLSGRSVVPGIAYDNTSGLGFPAGRLAMVRYTSAGALDTSFDADGKVVTDFGSGRVSSCGARIADSSGKVVVYGTLSYP